MDRGQVRLGPVELTRSDLIALAFFAAVRLLVAVHIGWLALWLIGYAGWRSTRRIVVMVAARFRTPPA